jgi:hypothetical protein
MKITDQGCEEGGRNRVVVEKQKAKEKPDPMRNVERKARTNNPRNIIMTEISGDCVRISR